MDKSLQIINKHIINIKLHNMLIAPTCFGALAPSSGGLQVELIDVMDYHNNIIKYTVGRYGKMVQ